MTMEYKSNYEKVTEDWKKRFLDMGFTKVYPPGTTIETTIADLNELLDVC